MQMQDSFFRHKTSAGKLIADYIQLHLMNYLYAQLLFCSYFTRWCKLLFALRIFLVSDAKMQVSESIKNYIQKLAADALFPIGVILIGRV